MKLVDEYRNPQTIRRLVDEIRRICTRRWVLMEVCGGQTHGLLRYGIEELLSDCVELIHGPGCPVCVTPVDDIDLACQIAVQPEVILTSFGDMLRVPGHDGSLLRARMRGAEISVVYSPTDAVRIAAENPDRQVVFFAVGFETTAPATALAVLQAAALELKNFQVLVSHVRVLPAMELLVSTPDSRVQGFLAAGHVCTITGYGEYDSLARRYQTPVVVTGFEPVDLLEGIRDCVRQLESGGASVTNRYPRSVQRSGNIAAQDLISRAYQIADVEWRGFGIIPGGGLRLLPRYARLDARLNFVFARKEHAPATTTCPAAEILSGHIKPTDCPHFGTLCLPQTPLGAPMVSSEGACAAYFRYRPPSPESIATRDPHSSEVPS